jgi:hypothetical protein
MIHDMSKFIAYITAKIPLPKPEEKTAALINRACNAVLLREASGKPIPKDEQKMADVYRARRAAVHEILVYGCDDLPDTSDDDDVLLNGDPSAPEPQGVLVGPLTNGSEGEE